MQFPRAFSMTYQPAGLNRCLIACYKHFVKLAFCDGCGGNAGQERYQLAQEAHTSPFLAGLGFLDRLCRSLDLSIFYIIELCFSQRVLKLDEILCNFIYGIGKCPNL